MFKNSFLSIDSYQSIKLTIYIFLNSGTKMLADLVKNTRT